MSLLADLFNNPLIPKYEVKDYGLFCEGKFYEDMRLTHPGFTGPCPVMLPTFEGDLNPEELLKIKLSGEPIPKKKVVVPVKQLVFHIETDEQRVAAINVIDKITSLYFEKFDFQTCYRHCYGVLPQYKEQHNKWNAQKKMELKYALNKIREIVKEYDLKQVEDEDGEVDDSFGLEVKNYPREWYGSVCTGTITLLYTATVVPLSAQSLNFDLLNLQRNITI